MKTKKKVKKRAVKKPQEPRKRRLAVIKKPHDIPCPFLEHIPLQQLNTIAVSSGLLYIGDPSHLILGKSKRLTSLPTEKPGQYIQEEREVGNFDIFQENYSNWEKQQVGLDTPAEALILASKPFQEAGAGKGAVLSTNQSEAILTLKKEYCPTTGKLTRIIINVK